jgi:threonine aldolase
MLEDDLWLANARAANEAAATIAAGAAGRLLEPVEGNQLFIRMAAAERAALRAQRFAFYDHGADGARFVTAWDSRPGDCAALAKAISSL